MEEPILKKPLSQADATIISFFKELVIESKGIHREITESDAKVIVKFTELITYQTDTKYLIDTFTDLYVKYTRLLCKLNIDDMSIFIDEDTDNELYYLNEIIQVLKSE